MGLENLSQALEMFNILISVAVTYAEGHSAVYLRFVYFKFYFKKEDGKSCRCHDNLCLNAKKGIS